MTLRQILLVLLVATLVSGTALAAYDRFVRQPQTPRFGVLDVREIYSEKTRRLLESTTTTPAADPNRQAAAIAEADRFSAHAAAVVSEISRECACVLLARPAVVEGLPDYTDLARRRLGL